MLALVSLLGDTPEGICKVCGCNTPLPWHIACGNDIRPNVGVLGSNAPTEIARAVKATVWRMFFKFCSHGSRRESGSTENQECASAGVLYC